MPTYRINWEGSIYGSSYVEASSFDEAHDKVKKGEDRDFNVDRFEDFDSDVNWNLTQIIELDDEGEDVEERDYS